MIAALVLCPAGTQAATAAPFTQKLVPTQRGVLFGAWVDEHGRWLGNRAAENGVIHFETRIGRRLDVDHHYYAWKDTFPSGLEHWDVAGGRVPLISWGGTALDPILSGSQDELIRARARGVRSLEAKVFVRWGWEMNGNWSSHDGTHNNDPGRTNGPAKYVAAWRHIHDLFVQEGATNAVWVWSPNGTDVPAQPWNHWTRYYPGDAYVDWVGIDGYNWGTTQAWSSWMPFARIVRPVYASYAGRKPIMVAETASAEAGGDKARWLLAARRALKTSFPAVRALVYFNAHKETDWRADSSNRAYSAFRALATDGYFNAGRRRVRPFGVRAQPLAAAVESAFRFPSFR